MEGRGAPSVLAGDYGEEELTAGGTILSADVDCPERESRSEGRHGAESPL